MTILTDTQIKYMVNRFLGWRLPEDFQPDGGISFKPTYNEGTPYEGRHQPSGTSLFNASQAEAMIRHLSEGLGFQDRVSNWLRVCFKNTTATSQQERGDRFLEEALEMLQSVGYPKERIPALVEYVYSRPPGEPFQEVGGVMTTLAAFCWRADVDMHIAAETELARVSTPAMIARLRAKDDASDPASPLPGVAD